MEGAPAPVTAHSQAQPARPHGHCCDGGCVFTAPNGRCSSCVHTCPPPFPALNVAWSMVPVCHALTWPHLRPQARLHPVAPIHLSLPVPHHQPVALGHRPLGHLHAAAPGPGRQRPGGRRWQRGVPAWPGLRRQRRQPGRHAVVRHSHGTARQRTAARHPACSGILWGSGRLAWTGVGTAWLRRQAYKCWRTPLCHTCIPRAYAWLPTYLPEPSHPIPCLNRHACNEPPLLPTPRSLPCSCWHAFLSAGAVHPRVARPCAVAPPFLLLPHPALPHAHMRPPGHGRRGAVRRCPGRPVGRHGGAGGQPGAAGGAAGGGGGGQQASEGGTMEEQGRGRWGREGGCLGRSDLSRLVSWLVGTWRLGGGGLLLETQHSTGRKK